MSYTLRVFASFDMIDKFNVRKIVHVYLILEHNNNLLSFEPDPFNIGSEAEFSYTLPLMVIPEHNFVGRVLWVRSSSNEGQNVAAIEHFNNSNAATEVLTINWGERSTFGKSFFERICWVDFEASLSSDSETPFELSRNDTDTLVLIEAYVKNIWFFSCFLHQFCFQKM